MATTKTFPVTKDARIARRESDNWDSGSGSSDGLPYGLYGGYRYRVLLGFSINMSGWTSITSAYLKYKTSNQIHVGFGSDPTFKAQRITTSWSEGSSSGLSASNSVIYPGPSVTATNDVIDDAPTAESTWGSVTITAMMRDVLAGNAFHGIRLIGTDNAGAESDSSANVGEIFSREQGAEAYIEITYETNQAPNTPVILVGGESGGIVNDLDPTLTFTLDDPDTGDILTQYQWEVATTSAFTAGTFVDQHTVVGSFAQGTVINHTTVPLTRGTTYYARARAYDGSVWGAYSATKTFKIASLPVVAITEPSGAGRLGRVSYDAGSGWLSPRLRVDWTFSCPDGGTQASYRVEVYNDAAGAVGSVLNDSMPLPEAATRTRIVPADLTEGAYYHVRVTCVCSHGVEVIVGFYRIRVRWGVATHVFDMGAGVTSLSLSLLDVLDETTGGSGRIAVEYATLAAAPPTAPGSTAWRGSIASAGLLRYFWYRVWLLTWGASPAVSPALNELKIGYSSVQIIPDKWTREDTANEAGDVAAFVYGTKSIRLLGDGAAHAATQRIDVVPNTFYVLSARIQSDNASGAYAAIATSPTGGDLVTTPPMTATVGFEQPESRVFSEPWFSGSNTSVYVRLVVDGPVGASAWFDAIKMEASRVVTPWSPGYIANAVVLDSGGVQIDAFNGGIFRLRGSGGLPRHEITLGASGIVFGGDTELASPSDGIITVDGNPIATLGPAPIRRIYTTPGSNPWTRPPGLSHIEVEVQGGGGGGAGTPATAASQGSSSGGGGGGGYARRIITAAELTAAGIDVGETASCDVATGGAGGVGGVDGTSGAASGFTWPTGVQVRGNGGGGGNFVVSAANSNNSPGGTGGSATGDAQTILVAGSPGMSGKTDTATTLLANGGNSVMGGGGRGSRNANGGAAGGYGGGGGGVGAGSSLAALNGGAGTPGCIIVTEFYSGIPAGSVVPIVTQGFAFPTAPTLNDRFFHLTRGMEYQWNGTRWLCTCAHWLALGNEISNQTATFADMGRATPPSLNGNSDIWIEDFSIGGFNIGSGTALSASHKWEVTGRTYSGALAQTSPLISIASGANGWRVGSSVPWGVLAGGYPIFWAMSGTKTGTPGNIYVYGGMSYRYVG